MILLIIMMVGITTASAFHGDRKVKLKQKTHADKLYHLFDKKTFTLTYNCNKMCKKEWFSRKCKTRAWFGIHLSSKTTFCSNDANESFFTTLFFTLIVTPSPASRCNAPSKFNESIIIVPFPRRINVDRFVI